MEDKIKVKGSISVHQVYIHCGNLHVESPQGLFVKALPSRITNVKLRTCDFKNRVFIVSYLDVLANPCSNIYKIDDKTNCPILLAELYNSNICAFFYEAGVVGILQHKTISFKKINHDETLRQIRTSFKGFGGKCLTIDNTMLIFDNFNKHFKAVKLSWLNDRLETLIFDLDHLVNQRLKNNIRVEECCDGCFVLCEILGLDYNIANSSIKIDGLYTDYTESQYQEGVTRQYLITIVDLKKFTVIKQYIFISTDLTYNPVYRWFTTSSQTWRFDKLAKQFIKVKPNSSIISDKLSFLPSLPDIKILTDNFLKLTPLHSVLLDIIFCYTFPYWSDLIIQQIK